ncbi:T9SS type B sorting domain-containing protein [Flavobacterium piscinae]|uniref:T9SS type B sorting domain-containing protein n=1 Tax=Flavobacterium piscinae TaxID=2506424 RepID=A0A4Q1KQM2_9FLAO|nr:choice-of-anchor L domain-containing protein [Flavobacterium piscinae]RXR31820.1 T9SS type B sorting domain-containing protein [Flavobacterium piscinae]
MKFAKNIAILLLTITFTQSNHAQYILVDDNRTVEDLVENILINSSCANVSNISVSGWAFTSGNSYGFFNASGTSFPFEDGVIISTGRAASAVGPNGNLLSEGPTNWLGDNDLQNAINENNTINATVIEFDFLPFANKVSFDYIFSSEQYLSNPSPNQCNFSDGFAFLLKEASSSEYTNLAVVPNTNIPVKITTVRGQGTICPPANEEYFDAFNGFEHPTNYNGQTKILKAESNVTPGVLYHIKLVIADQGNNLYDSSIFLGGGSFTIETDLGEDRLIATGNPLCPDETLLLNATNSTAVGYKWFRNTIEIIGETGPTLLVDDFGIYKVEVIFNPTCSSFGEIEIEYSTNPVPNDTTLTQCDSDGDGFALFNLNDANNDVIGSNTNVGSPFYYLTQADAENAQNPIANFSSFQNTVVNQVIYARLQNNFGCFGISEVTLSTSNNTVAITPFAICDGDVEQNGITAIDLNNEISPTLLSNFTPGLVVNYYPTEGDAQLQVNQIASPYINLTAFQEIIFARITDGVSCFGIIPITININTFVPTNFENETLFLCENESLIIGVDAIFESYVWNNGETTPEIVVNQPGTYIVTVTNTEGCTAQKTFIVTASGPATITSINIKDFAESNNTVEINYTGLGNYVFSLDGSFFQNSPIFTNVSAGEYTITINDLNGCEATFETIIVLDYPKFFTPNGDGINDYWKIENLNQPAAKIYIFNRYGKFLKQIGSNGLGWDGNFSGSPMQASDYWFTLYLEDGRIIKGHFTLKR